MEVFPTPAQMAPYCSLHQAHLDRGILMQAPELSTSSTVRLRRAIGVFKETFGPNVSVWWSENSRDALDDSTHWQLVSDETNPAAPNPMPPSTACLDSMPNAQAVPTGGYLLSVPMLTSAKAHYVATALVSTDSPELLVQLARRVLQEQAHQARIAELEEENQSLVLQVTDDFEELIFLRDIADFLEVSTVSENPLSLIKKVLPRLTESIGAASLVFIPNLDDTDEPTVFSKRPHWCGPRTLTDDALQLLVAKFRAEARRRPVVHNHIKPSLLADEAFAKLREFVLVPLASNDSTAGWLVAVNRSELKNQQACDDQWALGRDEFGTCEASLLGSAASIFASHATNVQLFRGKEQVLTSAVRSLVSAIEAKDEYTRGHSDRVALYGRRIATEMGYDFDTCERLYLTGILHDVGKIGVPDATLTKPNNLTDEEYEQIQQHPDDGWGILQGLDSLSYVLPGVLHHHERYDGRGYPDGLSGEAIPIEARILAVADSFDAMTSTRPYRQGMPIEKAVEIIRAGAGEQWDPKVVEAFLTSLSDLLEIRNSYRPTAKPTRPKSSPNPITLDSTAVATTSLAPTEDLA